MLGSSVGACANGSEAECITMTVLHMRFNTCCSSWLGRAPSLLQSPGHAQKKWAACGLLRCCRWVVPHVHGACMHASTGQLHVMVMLQKEKNFQVDMVLPHVRCVTC